MILIASVLKPVNDTRLYHKFGKTLAKHFPEKRIHIVGFCPAMPTIPEFSNIQFYPVFHFTRLSFRRVFANFILAWYLWKIRPKVLIISTFELLPIAVFYRLFFRVKLLYDVRENYAHNILYTQVFPKVLRALLAGIVRVIERTAHFWIHAYLLAERCYAEEMPWMSKKAVFAENKFDAELRTQLKPTAIKPLTFLYSGTIATDYGIFEAFDWIQALHTVDDTVRLQIIGYCPNRADFERLQAKIQQLPFVELSGGDSPVNHRVILQAMTAADWLLMPYQVNKSVENRIPTKFYEALALQKRCIIQPNPAWQTFFEQYPSSEVIFQNFRDISNLSNLYPTLRKTTQVVPENQISAAVFWQSEAVKLIQAIEV